MLFDGTDLSKWQTSEWKVEDGEIVAVTGNLTTKEAFGDCQLHLEWQAPTRRWATTGTTATTACS